MFIEFGKLERQNDLLLINSALHFLFLSKV